MGIYLSVCVFKVAASPAPSLALALSLSYCACLCLFFLAFVAVFGFYLFIFFTHCLQHLIPPPPPLHAALLSFDSFKFPMLLPSLTPSLGHSCALLPHHFDALERVFVVEFYLSLFNF